MKDLPLILYLTAPFRQFMPYVRKPTREISFREKCIWTVLALIVYLIACQIPLYGVIRTTSKDPLLWFRTVLASKRFSLMELGIGPIVTSSMIVQLLSIIGLLKVDGNDKKQISAIMSGEKMFSMLAILFESILLLRSGVYGSHNDLGIVCSFLIISQLVLAGLVVILLDELLEAGYGLGSGISLFIATNTCENLFWYSFSPAIIHTASGIQFEGAFIETNFTNISNIITTVIISLFCIYTQSLQAKIALSKRGSASVIGHYPIKITTSSNVPVIFLYTMLSNIFSASRILFRRYGSHFIVKLLGRWEVDVSGQYHLVGGLAYYINPINSITEIWIDPIHFISYTLFVAMTCGAFSFMWLEMSSSSPSKVARHLDSKGLVLSGLPRRDIFPVIERYIRAAAVCGGFIVGFVSVASSVFGSAVSGTEILMLTSLIHNYCEMYEVSKDY